MAAGNRVSTGIPGFDGVIDMLRLGDNVVWQVQSVEDYVRVVTPYVEQANREGRRIIYFRFGSHPPLPVGGDDFVCHQLDPSGGFEGFAVLVHNIIEREGRKVFYVFDCLSDLLESWHSDLMIGNFFRVTCPFLYQLDTIAYFALLRGTHTYATVARIRETTQLLLDLYCIEGRLYIHPLKAWERYSPTMFFPHLIGETDAVSITASADAAELFSGQWQVRQARDYWEAAMDRARDCLSAPAGEQEVVKDQLIHRMIGRESRIVELSRRYFTLADLVDIAAREIGSGFIGGKSVGMLLARKVLETDMAEDLAGRWEPHDSYYLGSDIYYTYIVQNGWWELYTRQKSPEGYFREAPRLREKLLGGRFPDAIREQFLIMLEHFGQSPIIVRSSSLLEDNFGNAFAGKYESVFCANQGSPEERYEAFEQAVREVYASTMSPDALSYRRDRGLGERDEQMAVLVQRVSGDHYGELFFPHVAGVGNSVNLYLWEQGMDPGAGMLRLVFGLGTRAVDRVPGDYARIVSLDRPSRRPPVTHGDEKKFSQHNADVLNLRENRLTELPLTRLLEQDIRADRGLFFTPDYESMHFLLDRGISDARPPEIADFHKLLTGTAFAGLCRKALKTLEAAYDYPVDMEYTANFSRDGSFRWNLLQCRPQQTRGLGKPLQQPKPADEDVLIAMHGNFMGGNVRLDLGWVLYVLPGAYVALSESDKYSLARLVGELNQKLDGERVLLVGPGRWGTTTPSLGVPVHFTEISRMTAVCEVAHRDSGLMPELSFGSHFFQDIVESGIFYAAVFDGDAGVTFRPEKILQGENRLADFTDAAGAPAAALHLARLDRLTLYADIVSQTFLCYLAPS